mgnify:FL=1|tara:strand:- start:425 stop:1726 length:1302 start_codon:yes stop_codon:yes gene_type:complete
MASTYLTRTQGTPTSTDIGTISFWVKRGTLSKNNEYILQNYIDSSNYGYIRWKSDDELQIFNNSINDEKRTNRVFRDTNSWYHIVLRVDTTQSTANDRVRLYINGVQETSFNPNTNGSQNADYDLFKSGGTMRIGYVSSGTATYFDGCLSHFHYCDGQSYAPTVFGSTDSTTGEWKINTSPTITMGSQGFTILKDGNTITDQSSNSNDFTLGGGTLTKTEDNPSNVFAVWNRLDHKSTGWNMQNGNTRLQGTGGDSWETRRAISTIGASSGKYYAELKMTTAGNDSYPFGVGYNVFDLSYSSSMGSNSNFWGYYQPAGGQIYGGGTGSPLQTGLGGGTGDIIGIALDIDNLTLQFYKNGSTMGSQITGLPSGKTWFFASSGYGNTNTFDCNFGNGYFGSTQISSAGTNASGIGIFEYDVPSGYTALSTKGLNE